MGMKDLLDPLLVWLSALTPAGVALGLAAVSALATALAAFAAWRRVAKLGDANFARIFLSFSERYNSEEMASALRSLVKWRQTQGAEFAETWNGAYLAGDAPAADINKARRLVSRFYQDVARLYEVGLINRAFGRALLASNGLHVYYEICAPMNAVHDPERYARYDEQLKKIRRKYAAGKVRLPAPANVALLSSGRAA